MSSVVEEEFIGKCGRLAGRGRRGPTAIVALRGLAMGTNCVVVLSNEVVMHVEIPFRPMDRAVDQGVLMLSVALALFLQHMWVS